MRTKPRRKLTAKERVLARYPRAVFLENIPCVLAHPIRGPFVGRDWRDAARRLRKEGK